MVYIHVHHGFVMRIGYSAWSGVPFIPIKAAQWGGAFQSEMLFDSYWELFVSNTGSAVCMYCSIWWHSLVLNLCGKARFDAQKNLSAIKQPLISQSKLTGESCLGPWCLELGIVRTFSIRIPFSVRPCMLLLLIQVLKYVLTQDYITHTPSYPHLWA